MGKTELNNKDDGSKRQFCALKASLTAATANLKVPIASIAERRNRSPLAAPRDLVIFSDFDGTIFLQDTGHILFDARGCGAKKRTMLDEQIKDGSRTFRDVSEEMWGSLNVSFEDGFKLMKEALEIDPNFREFHQFCLEHAIPFHVISAGLKPVLRRVLDEFLGKNQSKNIDIMSNEADISPDGSQWKPIWRHNSSLGHDKAATIKEFRAAKSSNSVNSQSPLIVFIGDGISDLPAAKEADVLFARKGLHLEEYCMKQRIPFIPFDTFKDIQDEIVRIVQDDTYSKRPVGLSRCMSNPTNFWRQISSQPLMPNIIAKTPVDERFHCWPEFAEVGSVPRAMSTAT